MRDVHNRSHSVSLDGYVSSIAPAARRWGSTAASMLQGSLHVTWKQPKRCHRINYGHGFSIAIAACRWGSTAVSEIRGSPRVPSRHPNHRSTC